MFVLQWKLSPYDAHDWTLGVFTSKRKAKAAKKTFIAFLNKRGNPFEKQTYRECDLNKDLESFSIPGPSKSTCVMIFEACNAFGQTICNVVYIAGCEQEAQNQISKLNKEGSWACYYFTKKCIINKYYDFPIANLNHWQSWKDLDLFIQRRKQDISDSE